MQKSILRLRSGLMVSRVEPSKIPACPAGRKNQKYKSKIKNFDICIIILIFAFSILNFMGCVSIPTREALPTYNINGITYIPLVSLCEQNGIIWDYDMFARTVILTKDMHKINLMVGDALILVDEQPVYLKHPVDIYQGIVIVPYKFKAQIIDVIFKEFPSPREVALPLGKIKKIVIDAGHGGRDPGAISKTGLREKNINLDIAKRLASILESEGFQVIMTRSTDTLVSLSSRADIANKSNADIFLSIHNNANRVKSLNGFEVYYVAASVDDSKRALWAAQNAMLDLDSSYFAADSLNLKAILWDMIYTNDRAESIKLAGSICRTIERNLDTKILGIKGARFYVLKGVRMPALLIEIGFLSNYNEERKLRNSYYRQQIAQSITQGLKNYTQDFTLSQVAKQSSP